MRWLIENGRYELWTPQGVFGCVQQQPTGSWQWWVEPYHSPDTISGACDSQDRAQKEVENAYYYKRRVHEDGRGEQVRSDTNAPKPYGFLVEFPCGSGVWHPSFKDGECPTCDKLKQENTRLKAALENK